MQPSMTQGDAFFIFLFLQMPVKRSVTQGFDPSVGPAHVDSAEDKRRQEEERAKSEVCLFWCLDCLFVLFMHACMHAIIHSLIYLCYNTNILYTCCYR